MADENLKVVSAEPSPSVGIPFCYGLMARVPFLEQEGLIIGASNEDISTRLGEAGCMASCGNCKIRIVVEKGAEALEAAGTFLSDIEAGAVRPIKALYSAAASLGRVGTS